MCFGGRKLQHFLKLYESSLNYVGKGPTNKSKKRMGLDVCPDMKNKHFQTVYLSHLLFILNDLKTNGCTD
jgi:hypothetical protein